MKTTFNGSVDQPVRQLGGLCVVGPLEDVPTGDAGSLAADLGQLFGVEAKTRHDGINVVTNSPGAPGCGPAHPISVRSSATWWLGTDSDPGRRVRGGGSGAAGAGLPKPRVYLIETEAPNAFATGRSPGKSAVAATTGLMRMLNRDELAGVMAHELAHIKHRDTLIASIAATVAGAITMLAQMAQWALIFGMSGLAGSEEDEGGGLADLAGGLVMIILAPIAALLIQLAISRSREYSADAGGAEILGDPLPLASALHKLEMSAGRTPMEVNPATSSLYIVNPLRGGLTGLFRTHPDTAERIKRLQAMARPEVQWAAAVR